MKILLTTDGSRYALAAARAVTGWFAWPGGEVDLLAVAPKEPKSDHRDYGKDTESDLEWRGTVGGWLASTASLLDASGLAVRELVRHGDPAAVAVETSREGFDLVVVGAKGRGDAPLLADDSVARALLEKAPTSVLLVRERAQRGAHRRMPTRQRPLRVLMALDGREAGWTALRAYARLVAADHVDTTVISVADPGVGALSEREASAVAERGRTALEGAGVAAAGLVRIGGAATEILEAAGEADLIVMGSRAESREKGGYLGSVGLEVARRSPCSVLLVRPAAPRAVEEPSEEPEAATPAEIAYEGMEPSPVAERYVLRGLRRLERVAPDLLRAWITVGARQRRRRTGDLYDVRLELERPGPNVVVSRTPPRHRESEDLPTAIAEAFAKARRMLVDASTVERGDVKTHEGKESGTVTDLFPDYGFIRGADGRIVYFHRNSVVDGAWDALEVGTEVRFVDEPGDEGPQATTVDVRRRRRARV